MGLAVFDMDRTLTTQAVAHVAGDALGFRDRVKALSARRDAGELTQQQVTEGIAALLAGVPVSRFERIVARIPLTEGALEAVDTLRGAGVEVALCSDSFSRAAEPVARKLGIGLWASNVLEEKRGAFTGKLRAWGDALALGQAARALDKREAVPLLARRASVPLARTAVVGDGDQDALAMAMAGLGIAYRGTPRARAAARHQLDGSLAPAAALVLAWLETAKP